MGVRRTAADEEEADAHHRGLRGTTQCVEYFVLCFETSTDDAQWGTVTTL